MNAQIQLDRQLEKVIATISATLKSDGFDRRGKTLRSISEGVSQLIEFQKSDKSDSQRIRFTVNLGIVCDKLLDAERTTLAKATVEDAHLRTRLGQLLSSPADIWWDLTASTDCDVLAGELSQLLKMRALPYLSEHGSEKSLIALWESGKSPGLTAVQRGRLLTELKAG
ncbi:MAG TPA: DUF4304 domain-containing protein [Burkholderiaceae bacterium]|nr:DUF4304 domain-containing protein [Burkholderiaceae bacterium]